VQEVAFTFADAIAYLEAALKAGLEIDQFAPRISFFFNSHNNSSGRDREVPRRAQALGAHHA
jgi:methylmalonyl-CoA mutase N-terminal domain/subunit